MKPKRFSFSWDGGGGWYDHAKADDLSDCFEYTQVSQPYTQLQLTYTDAFFRRNRNTRSAGTD